MPEKGETQGRPPPVGDHVCQCTKAERWKSPNKGTPAIMLTWVTGDGAYAFDDALYITGPAMWRLDGAARHVCGLSDETELPEGNEDAADWLADYLMDHAPGKTALVTIVQKGKYRQVAGAGYKPAPDEGSAPSFDDDPMQDIPF